MSPAGWNSSKRSRGASPCSSRTAVGAIISRIFGGSATASTSSVLSARTPPPSSVARRARPLPISRTTIDDEIAATIRRSPGHAERGRLGGPGTCGSILDLDLSGERCPLWRQHHAAARQPRRVRRHRRHRRRAGALRLGARPALEADESSRPSSRGATGSGDQGECRPAISLGGVVG